jgi:hypothetical protein
LLLVKKKKWQNYHLSVVSRKTIEMIKDVEAVIEITPSFTFINQKNDDSKRYVACNLSNDIKNGQKIVFSAEIKEIFPNERWAGTPIKLTSLTTK